MSDELIAAVTAVAVAASEERDPAIGERLRAAVRRLESVSGDDEWRERQRLLGAEIERCDAPIGAGLMASIVGGHVEGGAPAEVTTGRVASAFLRWCNEAIEHDTEIAEGLTYLGQALVAHLLRDERCRVELGHDAEVLRTLDDADTSSRGPSWVRRALDQRSGELVVLHGSVPVGVHASYDNVTTNFELFGLLQRELAGRFPGARSNTTGADNDEAWWHYGNALSPEPTLASMIFGELTPDSIPTVDGQQVLVVWEPILKSRSWSGFEGGVLVEAAPPRVRAGSRLTEEQVQFWYRRLGLGSQIHTATRHARRTRWFGSGDRSRDE
jgi:hypothetical protein